MNKQLIHKKDIKNHDCLQHNKMIANTTNVSVLLKKM